MDAAENLARVGRSMSGAFDRIAVAANAVGTLAVLALVVVMNVDVVARGVFNAPFRGAHNGGIKTFGATDHFRVCAHGIGYGFAGCGTFG